VRHRLLRLVVFYVALASVVLFVPKVHAQAPQQDMAECIAFAAVAAPAVFELYEADVQPAVIKYLVLTAPSFADRGRWLLLHVLAGLELAELFGKPMAAPDVVDLIVSLCALPPAGTPAQGRGEFIAPPTEI
jgi:hypothetical protein